MPVLSNFSLILYINNFVPHSQVVTAVPKEIPVKLLGGVLLLIGMAGFAFAPVPAPEISPDSATTALALISGAVLVMRGRRRK